MIKIKKNATIQDLLKIKSCDNGEKLIDLKIIAPQVVCQYEQTDMIAYVGDKILLRQTLASKIAHAQKLLENKYPNYKFKIVYGYRHPEIQKKYFLRHKKILQKLNPKLSDQEINELTHLQVAHPDVAGHSVGSAIDITIITPSGELDMGTKIADFSDLEKIKTFCKTITPEQKKNRLLLLNLMTSQGIAPFFGEWWHFCYGDKEWAYYYNKKSSLYSEIFI